MKRVFERLMDDVRMKEGLHACMNCGVCTAICPAAEVYNYDPRMVCDTVQTRDDENIEALLKSETIWYCGECMSCKTRCPRGNTVGLVIMALRSLSQDLGYFVESEKGRQQLYLRRTIGQWILNHGYCLYLHGVGTDAHPEQGPVWDWVQANWEDVMKRLGANYQGTGPGILRRIPEEALDEIRAIFEVTGGNKRYETIERYSADKARQMNLGLDDTLSNPYIQTIYSQTVKQHE
jgi:heterodisulfide reductase subunit C